MPSDANEPPSASEGKDPNLRRRVERLEQAVGEQRQAMQELRDEVRRLRAGLKDAGEDAGPGSINSGPGSVEGAEAAADGGRGRTAGTASLRPGLFERLAFWRGISSEDWLNYAGIGLLLFGLAFLFKYSVDRGWLVPAVRVGFGGLLGSALLAAGLRIYRTRRRLRQILLGGSSATFYATVFAAYSLYGLASYSVSFACMVAITAGTIGLAVREDQASLAVVGTIGGLGTPFLLPTEAGRVGGLAAYVCTVLAGGCTVVLARGWRSLLYTAVVGGWGVLVVAAARIAFGGSRPPDTWALQVAIGIAWLLLAATPVLRARREARAREAPAAENGPLEAARPAYGLVVASPLLALLSSRLLWGLPDLAWAGVALVGATVYAGAYAGACAGGARASPALRAALLRYAPVHGVAAAVLLAYGTAEGVGGSPLLLMWAVEAGGLLWAAGRLSSPALRWTGHLLYGVVAVGMAVQIEAVRSAAEALVRPQAGVELAALAVLATGSAAVRRRWLRRTYWGVALVGWLAWWAGELYPLANGQAYTSAVWGATAVALLVGSVRAGRQDGQAAGLAVLGAFVAKLFLVDLAALPALGRIALFLGFGAAFLAVSYLLPGLSVGRPGVDSDETDGPADEP
jgi:uncharacterized membrane protein